MAGECSDGEDSVGHEAELVDATADAEVDLRLALREPILQQEEIPNHSRVLDQAAIDEQRRPAPPNGAKPKRSGHGPSLPLVMNARDHMPGATTRQGPTLAVVDMAYPGLSQCRQRAGIDMPARFQFRKASDL